MKGLLGILGSAWLLSLLGIGSLAVLIWYVGPLLALGGHQPFVSAEVRLWIIGLLLAGWAVTQLTLFLLARRRNGRLADQLAAGEESGDADAAAAQAASAEELGTMRERFADAMAVLKRGEGRRKLGGAWLYQLPWYLIIGPPGCGKTTALVNSGLRFPLAEQFGGNAIQGTGGTRNCDWWFTDEAVLLDTAGRYTTQDSYAEVDSAAWTGFLALLKKSRPRRPINGVLVALSLSDLLRQSDAEREQHARAVRARVQELYSALKLRCPIYLLFTKADLVAGFTEFFGDLGQEERRQVWGFTLPLDSGSGSSALEHFGDEYDALTARLEERLLARMQAERDATKRRLIFGFPRQFAALRQPIADFLNQAFAPSRFEQRPLVRGVYFTSGTQTGTPIDRVLGAIAANFAVGGTGPTPFTGTPKSYFVTRLLRDLVFAEAAVAGLDPRLERRRLWLRRGAFATVAALVLLGAAAWATSYGQNRAYVSDVADSVAEIEQQIDALEPEDRNPLGVLPLLDALRDIPGGYGNGDRAVPWTMGLGLYQGDKLGSQAQRAYLRTLHRVLLPRVILRMEDQIRSAGGDPDYLYDSLRVYLMLDEPERYDAETVQLWVTRDWRRLLPRDTTEEQHAALASHLRALLREPPVPLPLALDGDLIEDARDILNSGSLAERLYERLQRQGLGADFPDFTLPEAGGDLTTLVLTRPSGAPMTGGVPALYTYAAYHSAFEERLRGLVAAAAEDAWVLGPQAEVTPGSPEAAALIESVRERYLVDYAERWNALLDDMGLVPARDIQHAAEIARILADTAESPLRRILVAAAEQTELDRPPPQAADNADANGAPDRPASGADDEPALGERLDRYFGQPGAAGQAGRATPETEVSRRFAWLRALVGGAADGQQSPLDRLQQQLAQLHLHLSSIASAQLSGRSILAAGDGEQVQALGQSAARLPKPVAGLVSSLAQDSETLIAGGARSELNKRWTSQILPFCREAIGDRYPINRTSRRDTTLQDFGRLFGPAGLLDSFFSEHLAPLADTSGRTWRWAGDGLGIPASVLAQFQRAAEIREAFFAGGGKLPAWGFELTPAAMDQGATQFILDLGGQLLEYRHGPPRPKAMSWPSPDGIGRARIAFVGLAGEQAGATEDGAWAWLRLLDRARVQATGQEELFRVTFSVGDAWAKLDLRAASVRNPFGLDALRAFRCPERL